MYSAIQSPVAVITAKDTIQKGKSDNRSFHSIVAIVDVGTVKNSMLAAVEISADRFMNGNPVEVNVLSSAYDRNVGNLLAEAIAQENTGNVGVYYANKKAMPLIPTGYNSPSTFKQQSLLMELYARFPKKSICQPMIFKKAGSLLSGLAIG